MDSNPIYYVYEWVNADTGLTFYVGKGCKRRYQDKRKSKRSAYFLRYINKHKNCFSRIIIGNLTEKDAYEKEMEIIKKYRDMGCQLVNFDDGGRPGGRSCGEANGMYGKTHTEEAIKKIKEANIGRIGGKNCNSYVCEVYDISTDSLINVFDCMNDAASYIASKEGLKKSTIMVYFSSFIRNKIDNICGKYIIKKYRHIKEDDTVPSLCKEEGQTTTESIIIEKDNNK